MGYATYVVNDMQKEGGHTPDTLLGLNKFHLKVRLPFLSSPSPDITNYNIN